MLRTESIDGGSVAVVGQRSLAEPRTAFTFQMRDATARGREAAVPTNAGASAPAKELAAAVFFARTVAHRDELWSLRWMVDE